MDGLIAKEPSVDGRDDALPRPMAWQGRKVLVGVLLSVAIMVGIVALFPHRQPKTMEPRSISQKDDFNIHSTFETFIVEGVDYNSFAADDTLLLRFKSALYETVESAVDCDELPGVYPGHQPGSVIVSIRVNSANTPEQIAQNKQCLLALAVNAETQITQGIKSGFKASVDPFLVGEISTMFCAVADNERDALRRCDLLQQGVLVRTPLSLTTTSSCKTAGLSSTVQVQSSATQQDWVYETFLVEGVDFNSLAADDKLLRRLKSALYETVASMVDVDDSVEVFPGYQPGSIIATFLVRVGITPEQIAQTEKCLLALAVNAETRITQGVKAFDVAVDPFFVGQISTTFCAVADDKRVAWRRCDLLQQGVLLRTPLSLTTTSSCKIVGSTQV